MSPAYYQDREAQARAIERARHWLDRLTQLAQYETVVLRPSNPSSPATRRGRRPAEGRRERAQERSM